MALVETLRRGCSVLEAENENLSIDLSDDGGGLEDSKKDDAETHDSGLPIFTLTHDGEQFIVSANPEEQVSCLSEDSTLKEGTLRASNLNFA